MTRTICVRVVLPTDKLVRVTCTGSHPQVRRIIDALEQQSLLVHPQQQCEGQSRNIPADAVIISPASVKKSTIKPRSEWKLVLVRSGQNILELQPRRELPDPVSDSERGGSDAHANEKADASSSNAIHPLPISLQRSGSSSQSMTPDITLIKHKHISSRTGPLREARFRIRRPVSKQHKIFNYRSSRYHNRKRRLGSSTREQRIWRHQRPHRSMGLVNLLARENAIRCHAAPLRSYRSRKQWHARGASNLVLHAGMQFLDLLSALEAEVSSLLLFVRNAASAKSGVCRVDELLPPILRVARVLNQHKRDQQLPATAKVPISEYMQDLTRAMKGASAQSLLQVPVAVEGWVICAEWGDFWRNQRTEYACLCDDGILYFFANEKRCAEYLFELARMRNGMISELGKKNIRENAPKSQIDFAKEGSGWSVRKGDTSILSRHRHAFALFDARNKLRHILDVNTKVEADAWVTVISTELAHNQLCTTLKSCFTPTDYADTSQPNCATKATSELTRSRQCTGNLLQSAMFKPGQRAKFSLRWLHAQIERLKHGARQQRLKSINPNQAMKDSRRDSIQINGVVHPGTCMNQTFMALMATIRRYVLPSNIRPDALKHGDSSRLKSLGSSCSLAAAEMVAMRLAKELLICSSRTNGGGDILDALYLVIPSDHFCICPKAQTMEPIVVRLSGQPSVSIRETFLIPVAEITIKMTYSIIPNDSCSYGSTNADTVHAERNPRDVLSDTENGSATRCQATTQIEPFDVVGTYRKKLIGNFHSWEELEGNVSIEFLSKQR